MLARDKAEAVEKLQRRLPDEFGFVPGDEYINIYFNRKYVTEGAIDSNCSDQFLVHSVTVGTKDKAVFLASLLTEASQWFSLTPLPDDHYRVSVKVERRAILDGFVGRLWDVKR